MRLARWARGRDGERGFTLIEVVIAMMLLTIVIGLSTKSLISVIDQQSNLTQQTSAQNRNNTGMEFATRLLRQAVYPTGGTYKNSQMITNASANQVTFTARPSSTVDAVSGCTASACTTTSTAVKSFSIALPTGSTTLVWGSAAEIHPCTGVCTYGTPTPTTAMVYGVRNAGGTTACANNTTGTSVFRYFYIDPNGNPAEYVPAAGASLTAAQIAAVQYIEIDLYTQTQSGPMKPACVALTDRVELRNWQ